MTMMLWENPSSGASSAQFCLLGCLQEWDTPSNPQGVCRLTEASWSNLFHDRPPANFGQSGVTFDFTHLMTSQEEY